VVVKAEYDWQFETISRTGTGIHITATRSTSKPELETVPEKKMDKE
jgi:hypothetical protein